MEKCIHKLLIKIIKKKKVYEIGLCEKKALLNAAVALAFINKCFNFATEVA